MRFRFLLPQRLLPAALALMLAVPALAQTPSTQPVAPPPVAPPSAVLPNVQDAQTLRQARAARHLARFDGDRGGSLTRSEYQRWYRATARRRSALTWKRHASAQFRRLDANRDARLSLEEFAADPHFRRSRMGGR
ncbi:MAG: hypothetical protein ACRCXM_16545 [Beijerinckiaceae bacterium]